ncbi:MAG TPA: hypothetical protein VMX79_03975 [bacterium]|nr:hypothetical protein [bacterium]
MERELDERMALRSLEKGSVGTFVNARHDLREVAERLMVVDGEREDEPLVPLPESRVYR